MGALTRSGGKCTETEMRRVPNAHLIARQQVGCARTRAENQSRAAECAQSRKPAPASTPTKPRRAVHAGAAVRPGAPLFEVVDVFAPVEVRVADADADVLVASTSV